jgi:hypothetical protein
MCNVATDGVAFASVCHSKWSYIGMFLFQFPSLAFACIICHFLRLSQIDVLVVLSHTILSLTNFILKNTDIYITTIPPNRYLIFTTELFL